MEIVIKILQVLLSLSLLVFIHELGHFFFARLFGVRVDKFYIFFDAWNVSLLKFKIGETEFGIGWVPFGGYCKISGMIDESMDTKFLQQEPQPWEFRSKPAWQRLLVMTGGVIMNVILAAAIYIGMSYRLGEQYVDARDVRWGYAFSDLGHSAGFEDGDKIVSVGGNAVEGSWRNIVTDIMLNELPPVEVIRRDTERVVVQIPHTMMEQLINLQSDFMTPRMPFVVGDVLKGTGAAAGMAAQDSLVAVGGKPMQFYDEITGYLHQNAGQNVDVVVARAGAIDTLNVAVSVEGLIGVQPFDYYRFLPAQTIHYTLLQSVPRGIQLAGEQINNYWKGLKMMVKPETGAYKSVGGFIRIGSLFSGDWDWTRFWSLTAMLSVMLGVLNILPIPALDGGHVLFLLWEVVTRRRPSDKFLERAQVVGLVIFIALMVLATGNDIYHFFIK